MFANLGVSLSVDLSLSNNGGSVIDITLEISFPNATPKENTWNPPESVIVGPFQFINLLSPPSFFTLSAPGSKYRWYVFANTTSAPVSKICSGVSAGAYLQEEFHLPISPQFLYLLWQMTHLYRIHQTLPFRQDLRLALH